MAKEPGKPIDDQPDFGALYERRDDPASQPKRVARVEGQSDVPPAQAWQEAAPDVAQAGTNIRLETVDFEVKSYDAVTGKIELVVTSDNPHVKKDAIYEIDFKKCGPILAQYPQLGDLENPPLRAGDGLCDIGVFVKPNGEIAIKPYVEPFDMELVQFISPKQDGAVFKSGVVKFYSPTKGFGYILREGEKDLYIEKAAADAFGGELKEGQPILYQVEIGPKGPRAVNLKRNYGDQPAHDDIAASGVVVGAAPRTFTVETRSRPKLKPRRSDPEGNNGQS